MAPYLPLRRGVTTRILPRMFYRLASFAFICGAAVAIVVTVVVTVWEWLENPGGIFRDAAGTQWDRVGETAASWFGPTFLAATLVALTGHLLWIGFRRLVGRQRLGT